jgi:hypothetical protein
MRASDALVVGLLLVLGSDAVAVDDTWDTFTPVDTFVAVADTDLVDTDDSDKVEETDVPSDTDDSDWVSDTDSDGGSETDSDANDTAYAGGALASALTGEQGGPACAMGPRPASGALLLLVFGALSVRRRARS